MLPFLEVEHLPSSSSFYSAVIQPLGLRYLSTEDGHFPSITYGNSLRTAPVFQIRQVVPSRDRPLRTSRIVLSAPSPAAADDAYEFALRAAHPRDLAESHTTASGLSARRTGTGGGGTRVVVTDFDGNMMEIAYQPPPDYPSHYSGPTIRYTRSTTEEVTRILDWNYDVASSSPPAPAGPSSAPGAGKRTASRRSYARYPEEADRPHPGLKRSVTTGSSVYEPATSVQENSKGLSAGAVVGTLLGVAAGAALGGAFTYNMARSDKSRGPRPDYDMPPFSRRSTFLERYDGYSDRKSRYVDVERAMEKVHYESDYPPASDYRRPAPEYIARYSQVSSPRSREMDGVYDSPRGRHPSARSRASSARARSESADHKEPYGGGDVESRRYVSSKSSRHPPLVQRTYTYETPDRESYVSARSRRSSSTVRAPAPPDPYAAPTHMGSRPRPQAYSREGSYVSARHVPPPDSRAPSYISARDIPLPESRAPTYLSARDIPLPDSRAPSYISARDVPIPDNRAYAYTSERDMPLPMSRPATYLSAHHVPLPESHVGSSYAKRDDDPDDDDADSIAPSDSISCVGSRRSGRLHH